MGPLIREGRPDEAFAGPGRRDPWRKDGVWTTPLVAAVQGWVMTLAIELLLAADIRIAASNARFQQLEIRRGIYAFGGATIRLPRDAGWGNAMRWLLTGEEYDAAEAYHAEERLPTVCDIAGPLLQSARLDTEPPILVRVAQDAISWLARAIAELDESSAEAPTSLAETLARLLAVWTFADVTLRR